MLQRPMTDSQLCVAVYSGFSVVWPIATKPGLKDSPFSFYLEMGTTPIEIRPRMRRQCQKELKNYYTD